MGDVSGRRWPTVAAFMAVVAVAGGSVWRIEQVEEVDAVQRRALAEQVAEDGAALAEDVAADAAELAATLAADLDVRCRERNRANERVREVFALVLAAEDLSPQVADLVAPGSIDRDCSGDGMLGPDDYPGGPP